MALPPSLPPEPPSMPDLDVVARVWGLRAPVRAEPLPEGTNNLILRLETGGGPYVLRIYRNTVDPARLTFEGEVLRRLAASGLPFAVPAPLPTVDGAALATLPLGGDSALAVLEPFLRGTRPRQEDLLLAEDAGRALALLDQALPTVPEEIINSATTWRSYGDLEHCHPLVPDPRGALATLPVPEETRRGLLGTYDALQTRIPLLYASLPRQLVHEDYAPSNTLALDGRLGAVLDFEFCTRDVRVMDIVVGLSWWPGEAFGTGAEWPILRAFARGYGGVLRLTEDEVRAFPTLYLLRGYTSLIHRLGRYRQGLSSLDAVQGRATAALDREDWLNTNRERLLALLAETVGVRG